MFGTLKTIIGILFEREPEKPQNIVVSLDELCQIWLPYNNSFQPAAKNNESWTTTPPKVASSPDETPTASPESLPVVPESSPSAQETAKKLMEFNTFYEEVIEPYRSLLVSQGLLDGVNRILDILNKRGDCPSIVADGADLENREIAPIREALLKVSLRDHTFRVTRNAVKLMKEIYQNSTGMAPITIIAALCHDIGKTTPTSKGTGIRPSKHNHPILSTEFVQEVFGTEFEGYWLNLVKNAIRDHHAPSTDQFTLLLKEADSMARTAEVAENSLSKTAEWDDWFSTRELLALIKPYVNRTQTGSVEKAFSMNETVYLDHTFLHEMARKMAADKGVLDVSLSRDEDKEAALRKILASMRESGHLSEELGKGYINRKYDVQFERRKKSLWLVPVKLSAFDAPDEIEAVKDTYAAVIKDIRPAGR